MNFPQFDAEVARMLSPLFVLAGGGCLALIMGVLSKGVGKLEYAINIVIHLVVLWLVIDLWNFAAWPVLGGMVLVDQFALFFTAVIVVCSLATVLTSNGYLRRFGIDRSEYYAMLYFASAGMFVLVSAYNLISVFLGIELMSLAIYIMVGFRRRDFFANEAAMKYFLLGAFAIAFFLYGMALIYGLTDTLNLKGIVIQAMERGIATSPPFLLAIGLLLVGFVFKVSAVPFHMWVPDVYQGAPSPVTGYMATAVKAASFAAFLRLFYTSFMPERAHWVGIIVVFAVLTMTIGNIVALVQRNIKRMMAYSSIAHAGYILVGMAAISVDNTKAASSMMYYLLVYAFMTIGAFALISALEKRGGTRGLEVSDYAGLGLRRPFLGLAMATFMLSLAGIPPTAGFFAKYYIFSAAIEKGLVTLVVIGVLNSALSLYYYLRVVVVMYMRKADQELPIHADLGTKVVLFVSLLAVIWLGIGPSGVIPGIDSILQWTSDSLTRIVALR